MTLSPRAQQSLNKPLFWSYCTLVVWANVLRKIKKIKIPSPSSSSSQEGEHLCGMSQSPHQLMFNLYNIIALTGENQIVQYFKFIIVNLPLYILKLKMWWCYWKTHLHSQRSRVTPCCSSPIWCSKYMARLNFIFVCYHWLIIF